jgi:hypothetical protein
MDRLLALVAALLMSTIAVSSACIASSIEPIAFTAEQKHQGDKVRIDFRRADQPHTNRWSTALSPAELAGLDIAGLRSPDTRPIRFAIIREAGRLDCSGTGGNMLGKGNCSLTPDTRFNDFLAANGVARPSREQTFGLIAVNAKRELVTALRSANYPAPNVRNFIGLSAVGVTDAYVGELARAGYRPKSLNTLLQFKALDITPEYIAGFEKIGYRHLPASTLIRLKAMDVTPEFVRAVQQGDALPSPRRLVTLKALGRRNRDR